MSTADEDAAGIRQRISESVEQALKLGEGALLFAPEDLALVKGDPSDRRRFVDELLVQRSPRYAAVKADYDRWGAAIRKANIKLD